MLTVVVESEAALRKFAPGSESVNALLQKGAFTDREAERLREFLRVAAPKALFVPAFYGVTGEEEYRSRASVDRSLGGGDQSRVVRNIIARLDSQAFARLNKFVKAWVGATLVRRTTPDEFEHARRLEVYFRDTNGELELASAGAGLINLIALYAIMEQSRPEPGSPGAAASPVIYLLDEPEAHLHPRLQGDVGEALAAAATDFRAQLLIATHSVEMINRLGQNQEAALLAVDRTTSTVTRLGSESDLVGELGKWCDLTPFSSLNFLASRRILFHEGPSDGEILRRCAATLFRTRAPEHEAFGRWTLVSLDGVGNVKAQGVLGAVLSPSVFPKLAEKKAVRAVCVLDRDAERSPGFRDLPKLTRDHFEARELVWSRYSIESLFLEPPRLAAWIAAALPEGAVSDSDLHEMVKAGVERASSDQDLMDDAEKALLLAHLHQGKKVPEAFKAAKEDVRSGPEIYQNGRRRAALVLGHVRSALPDHRLKNALPNSVKGLLERASPDRFSDRAAAVPPEIRELLEYMARSAFQ